MGSPYICIYIYIYVYTSRIAESYANSVFTLLRNCQAIFHSYHMILNSHQQGAGIPIPPRPPRHLLVSAALIVAILTGSRRYLIMVLILISLMTRDLGQLVMCWLVICVSCLKKCRFKSFAYFSVRLFVLFWLLLSYKSFLFKYIYILVLIPHQLYCLQIFHPVSCCLFTFLTVHSPPCTRRHVGS